MGDVYHIYALLHNPTNKLYIGCSKRAERVQQHLNQLRLGKHTNKAMQADCNKYGFDYTAYLLELVKDDGYIHSKQYEREAYWIHYYCTDDPKKGYNSSRFYQRQDLTGFKRIRNTKEVREMMSQYYWLKAEVDLS